MVDEKWRSELRSSCLDGGGWMRVLSERRWISGGTEC